MKCDVIKNNHIIGDIMKTKTFIVAVLSALLVSSCSSAPVNEDQLLAYEQLQAKYEQLNHTYQQLQAEHQLLVDKEDRNATIRSETLNLSFRVFAAMTAKDYDYMDSIASRNLKVNREDNQIEYMYGGQLQTIPFREATFANLQYRGTMIEDNTVTLFYATLSDGAFEFNMMFVLENNEWKFDGIIS